ncbi:MAG: DUF2341 domain-containing protein, partial [bacterium]
GGSGYRFRFGGSAANTYSGGTVLDAGRADSIFLADKNGAFGSGDVILTDDAALELTDRGATDNMIDDGAALRLAISSAGRSTVSLGSGVGETVRALYVNGAQVPAGTYSASRPPFFTGSGTLTVLEGGSVQYKNQTAVMLTAVGVTNIVLNGTNGANIVGLWWKNETTGNSGTVTPDAGAWGFDASLAVGPNTVFVYGSNSVGAVCGDWVVITVPQSTVGGVLRHRYSFASPASDASAIDSVGGQNGTYMNGLAPSSGQLSFPTDFNNNDPLAPYVNLPLQTFENYSEITIEAWLTPASGIGIGPLFWLENGDSIAISPQERSRITYGGYADRTPPHAPAGQERQMAYTLRGKELKYYENGVLLQSWTMGGPFSADGSANRVYINQCPNWAHETLFRGLLNEYRLYSNALDQASIQKSFLYGPEYVPDLVELPASGALTATSGTFTGDGTYGNPFIIDNGHVGTFNLAISGANVTQLSIIEEADGSGRFSTANVPASINNGSSGTFNINFNSSGAPSICQAAYMIVSPGELTPITFWVAFGLPYSSIPPKVAITNYSGTVALPASITSIQVAGTNNVNTVGSLWWTNRLNGAHGTVPASATGWDFTSDVVAGDNVVVVKGTNVEGIVSSDTVTFGVVQVDVTNRAPTVVLSDKATANGWLSNSSPSVPVAMYVCYGTTDKGTDASQWDEVVLVSANQASGDASKQLTGLMGATTYYYTFFASNVLEVVFAANSAATFTTSDKPEIMSAGNLLVDLKVSDLAAGPVTTWINNGTLGGNFTAVNDPATVDNANDTEQRGVRFDWDAFYGPIAPDSITYANDRSIEVWAYNIERYSEPKCMVELGCRDKAEGRHFAFSWGSNWLLEGWGWGNSFWDAGSPAANQWHHIVLTYSGRYLTTYDNGVQVSIRDFGSPGLDTFPGQRITLGTQVGGDGNAFFDWWASFNGYMSAVRIHDGVLTSEQIIYNYKAGMTPIASHTVVGGVTDLQPTLATLHGELLSLGLGDKPDIWVCYGTVSGGTNTGAWQRVELLGSGVDVGTFNKPVSGLTSGATYVYTFYAKNSTGATWSDNPGQFATPGVPQIVNLAPKGVCVTSAHACGNLVSTNNASTTVKLYYGPSDGGTDPTRWGTEVNLGILPLGEIDHLITGITGPVYYRYYATNLVGETWCPETTTITPAAPLDVAGYVNRLTLTISGYAGAETLVNFPALIKLNAGITGFSYGDFRSGNGDLRFTAADGSELNYEIDTWNPDGDSLVWVQVPVLHAGDTVRMYYGKAGVVPPVYATNGATWSENYVATWHMTNKWVRDSSGQGNHAEEVYEWSPITPVAGKIGDGLNFPLDDGGGGGGSTIITKNIKLTKQTLSAWVWSADLNDRWGTIMAKGDMWFMANVGTTYRFETAPWGGDYQPQIPSAGAWHYVVATAAGDGRYQAIYVDGELKGTWTKGAIPEQGGERIRIGAWWEWNRAFKGKLDELRMASVPRSADWIRAEYDNQNAPGTFVTAGRVQSAQGTVLMIR